MSSSGYCLLLSSHREGKPQPAQLLFVFLLLFFMDQRSMEFAQNKNALLRPSSSEQFHFVAPMNSPDPFPSCSRARSLRWHKWRICSAVLCACLRSGLKSSGTGHFPSVAESAAQEQESAVILLEVSSSYLFLCKDNVGRVLVSVRALGVCL